MMQKRLTLSCAWFKRISVCVVVLTLAACATTHQSVPTDARLDQREQQLMLLNDWSFGGKLGVKAPGESASLYISWDQRQDAFVIDLQGPLGQGSAKMLGDAEQVTLEHDGERAVSNSAEALIFERFGWRLPVEQLKYWVRALPAPGEREQHKIERDPQGLLLSQNQLGWQLQYGQYHWVGEQALPGKIRAESPALGVRLILVINQWQLGAEK